MNTLLNHPKQSLTLVIATICVLVGSTLEPSTAITRALLASAFLLTASAFILIAIHLISDKDVSEDHAHGSI